MPRMKELKKWLVDTFEMKSKEANTLAGYIVNGDREAILDEVGGDEDQLAMLADEYKDNFNADPPWEVADEGDEDDVSESDDTQVDDEESDDEESDDEESDDEESDDEDAGEAEDPSPDEEDDDTDDEPDSDDGDEDTTDEDDDESDEEPVIEEAQKKSRRKSNKRESASGKKAPASTPSDDVIVVHTEKFGDVEISNTPPERPLSHALGHRQYRVLKEIVATLDAEVDFDKGMKLDDERHAIHGLLERGVVEVRDAIVITPKGRPRWGKKVFPKMPMVEDTIADYEERQSKKKKRHTDE